MYRYNWNDFASQYPSHATEFCYGIIKIRKGLFYSLYHAGNGRYFGIYSDREQALEAAIELSFIHLPF